MSYQQFIESKIVTAQNFGLEISQDEINPLCKAHQKDIIQWAVAGGCRAIFAAFGLGKSIMQLECVRLVQKHKGGKALIVAPLGVRQEFKRDGMLGGSNFEAEAEKQGYDIEQLRSEFGVDLRFIRSDSEIDENHDFYITNYESIRDGKLNPNLFEIVSLDEASCLRSYGSKTYQEFLTIFKSVKYRFVCTATPSPNRFKELIHYAGFLGIMDTGQALTRFFQRDSQKANNLTLYPHKEKEFWFWVSSWAIFIQKPSNLGYSDDGYALPELKVHYHEVKSIAANVVDKDGQGALFSDAAISLQDASREKRETLPARIDEMMRIIDSNPDDSFILWHDQEIERAAINKAMKGRDIKDVYGSLDLETRENRIIEFSNGGSQYLSTKPVISGSGCNFQRHCHKAIFLGIGYKFNDFIQAVHRIYRFLQTEVCEIYIIYADSEGLILKALEEKWANHKKMVNEMEKIIEEHGLSNAGMIEQLRRSIGCERIEVLGENFKVANNDCVEECKLIPDNSVQLIHTSIPFSNHYEYSPSYNDFGHNTNNDKFFEQMDFLTPELYRILEPGRVAAIHVKDRILFGNVTGTGMPTVDPFHMHTAMHYMKHGFAYFGMITVTTDVVRENNQTYRLGWSEQCKDGSKMGVGSPEYVLLFRKLPTDTSNAYADAKVEKSKDDYTRARWQIDADSDWRSSGDRLLCPDELSTLPTDVIAKIIKDWSLNHIYNYESHVKIGEMLDEKGALPSTFASLDLGHNDPYVWHDVLRMHTLNGEQSKKGLNNHICPLQFDIVDRIITRYSNEGDLVFDPFGGLMTVPYRALKLKRKGRASELNPAYFMDGVKYLEAAEREMSMPSLFDALDECVNAV